MPNGPPHEGLRAIFVNPTHPDTPHVSSMRMRYFADAMAQRGHHILLLTPPKSGESATCDPAELKQALSNHDWSRPFHLACGRAPGEKHSSGGLFEVGVRRTLTLLQFVLLDGPQGGWVSETKRISPSLIETFKPEIIWATFGNISSLVLAQALSRRARAPWLMDIKDSWDIYVPVALRKLVALRFRDAAYFTANSHVHADIAASWIHQPHSIVYSGVAKEMFETTLPDQDKEHFRVTLIGSIYNPTVLDEFLAALSCWIDGLPDKTRKKVQFVYAGSATSIVEPAVKKANLDCEYRMESYLSLHDLGVLCRGAAVNCYLFLPTIFHHKLLELLACQRPVISFGGETSESVGLVSKFGGDLRVCTDGHATQRTLDDLMEEWSSDSVRRPSSLFNAEQFTWDALAVGLERTFRSIIPPRAL